MKETRKLLKILVIVRLEKLWLVKGRLIKTKCIKEKCLVSLTQISFLCVLHAAYEKSFLIL